jgi:tetratricopeptide (TPR) repeat protein
VVYKKKETLIIMTDKELKFQDSLKKARAHLEKKEHKNAQLMYFQALNLTSKNEDKAIIWAELSWVYYYEKEYQKAIEAAENVLMNDSAYQALDDLYRVQGYAYLSLNNFTLAERFLQLSLENNSIDEKQKYVKFELGKLHFIKGSYDLAHPLFTEIVDYFENANHEYKLSIWFYLGFIYYYLDNQEKSHMYFSQILSAEPGPQRLASAKFGLAFLEFRGKNYLNAITLCEEIISLDTNFFDKESVGFLTAASYFHLGRKDIFSEYYEKMKETYPAGRYSKELETLAGSIN